MRAIKFRAWDKQANKMRLVKSVNYADDGFAKTILVHLVDGTTSGYVHGESCELMQFTGLTDKNGVEIYESDIVYFHLTDVYAGPIEGKSKVYFDKGCFRLNDIHPLADYCNVGTVEAIGNIYENPELLR